MMWTKSIRGTTRCERAARARAPHLLWSLLLGLWGCGNGQILAVVTVSGITSDVVTIGAGANLNGTEQKGLEAYSPTIGSFGLELPPASRGTLQVNVIGVNQQGCTVSEADPTTTLAGQDRVDLDASLKYLRTPDCGN